MKLTRKPALERRKENARRSALARLDIAAMRAWLKEHAVAAFGDDRAVLISMHETRVLDVTMPKRLRRASVLWLRREHPHSNVLLSDAAQRMGV
jgi:hypothetical protein